MARSAFTDDFLPTLTIKVQYRVCGITGFHVWCQTAANSSLGLSCASYLFLSLIEDSTIACVLIEGITLPVATTLLMLHPFYVCATCDITVAAKSCSKSSSAS